LDHANLGGEEIPHSNPSYAQTVLAGLYYEGLGLPRDHKQALRWSRRAAQAGDLHAKVVLGHIYYELKNYKKAAQLYREAAAEGDPEAQVALGRIYYEGAYLPLDHKEAANWFRKAAEAQYPHGQVALARLYYYGQGVPKDHEEAANGTGKPPRQESLEGRWP
jgi:TPR repeat protein